MGWKIRYFFGNIRDFFKYDLEMFFLEHGLHVLAAVFAVVGIVAAWENVVWLAILGAIVAFLARFFGFFLEAEIGVSDAIDELPIFLKSGLAALIVAAIGIFPLRSLLEVDYGKSFLLSLNSSVLLFYVLMLSYMLLRFIRRKVGMWRAIRRIRAEVKREKKKLDDDDDDAGF